MRKNSQKIEVHPFEKRIQQSYDLAKKIMSAKNFDLFQRYDMAMIGDTVAIATRQHQLSLIISLTKQINKDWEAVTKEEIEKLVYNIMKKYSPDGKEKNENKALIVFKQFVDWLQEEHPNVMITFGRHRTQRPFEPLHPRTIKNYVKQIKYILEDCFGIAINDRQFKRKVALPKPEKFNPDPITKEELKLIIF